MNSRRQGGTTTTGLAPVRSLSTLVAKEMPTISSTQRLASHGVSLEHAAFVSHFQPVSRLATIARDTTGSVLWQVSLAVLH